MESLAVGETFLFEAFRLDRRGLFRRGERGALAACYAHMGRLDDARGIIGRLRTITPFVVPRSIVLRNPEHRELYLSGLRSAAGEAT
jgi:hypothetical protein